VEKLAVFNLDNENYQSAKSGKSRNATVTPGEEKPPKIAVVGATELLS
jgi:hypothetical protein